VQGQTELYLVTLRLRWQKSRNNFVSCWDKNQQMNRIRMTLSSLYIVAKDAFFPLRFKTDICSACIPVTSVSFMLSASICLSGWNKGKRTLVQCRDKGEVLNYEIVALSVHLSPLSHVHLKCARKAERTEWGCSVDIYSVWWTFKSLFFHTLKLPQPALDSFHSYSSLIMIN